MKQSDQKESMIIESEKFDRVVSKFDYRAETENITVAAEGGAPHGESTSDGEKD